MLAHCSHGLLVQSQQQEALHIRLSCKIRLATAATVSLQAFKTMLYSKYIASKTSVTRATSACIHISKDAVVLHRAHGMPADHLQPGHKHKAGSEHRSTDKGGQIPARHWGPSAAAAGDHEAGPAPEEEEEEEMGDSLDAFVVETRLVPVSLSQIPDQLPDHVSSLALHLSK